jgi:hypothetical protein
VGKIRNNLYFRIIGQGRGIKVLSFKILKLARVAESEDAQDLKSWAPKGA